MSGLAIEVSDITKSFNDRKALDRVSLQVDHNHIAALLGPNGGGKTTLFRILATLLQPESGSARICGFDPVTAPDRVRRMVGVVFQSPSLDKKLTAAENLRHHGHLFGMRGRSLERRIGVMPRSSSRINLSYLALTLPGAVMSVAMMPGRTS